MIATTQDKIASNMAVGISVVFVLAMSVLLTQPATAQTVPPTFRDIQEDVLEPGEQDQGQEEEVDPRDNPLKLARWGLKDACRFPDGRIVYLRDYYGPSIFKFSDADLTTLGWYNTNRYKYYTRIFRTDKDPKAVYAVEPRANGNGGHILYRHPLNGEAGKVAASFREKITAAKYLVTDQGQLFIYGRNGVIYRWAFDDGLTRYEIPVPEDFREQHRKRRTAYRDLFALVMGKGRVGFYSHVDPRYPKKQLRDLLIFGSPTPQRIQLKGKATGPAVYFEDSGKSKVRFCCIDRFVEVDLASESVTEELFERPKYGEEWLLPIHFFRGSDQVQIALWRRPFDFKKPKSAKIFDNGYLNQFAKLEDGKWVMLNQGKDSLPDKYNTHDFDSQGNLWMSMGHGGFMRIGIDGEISNFGFSEGMGFIAPSLIKVDRRDDFLMWTAIDGNQAISFVDTKKLIETNKTQTVGKWELVVSRIPLEWDKRNRFMLFSTAPGSGLVDYELGKRTSVPLPDGLNQKQPVTVTRDSNDEYWIFSEGGEDKTWWRHQGQWRMFQAQKAGRKVILPSKEVAFQTRMEMGVDESYVIGRRFNKYRVAFGPKRQIAFRNEGDRVSYFDGKRWSTSREGLEIPDIYMEQQVFFHDGLTTIYGDAEYSWNLKPEQWREHWETKEPRPWNRTDPIKYPYEGEQYFNVTTSHPAGGPFSEGEAIWGYRASNILCSFIRAHDEIAIHHPSGYWNIIPAAGTPLESDSSFSSIWVDADNRWFFEYPSDDLKRYVVYEPEIVEFTAVNPNLGRATEPLTTVKPQWKTNPPLTEVKYRFRVGESDWSGWIDENEPIQLPGFDSAGVRTLEVQLTSEPRPLRHHSIKYQFEVAYDLKAFLQPLFADLKSSNYEVRQKAVDQIIAAGKAAIPYLKPLLNDRNSELRMTTEMLIQLLDPNQAKEQDK